MAKCNQLTALSFKGLTSDSVQSRPLGVGRAEISGGVLSGVWGSKSPGGVQGQSPGRGSGDEIPQKLKPFC